MKRKDLTDTKALDLKALKQKAQSLRGEIADLYLDKKMNSLKDLKSISKRRRDLAQVLTIFRQKELLAVFETKVAKEVTKETK